MRNIEAFCYVIIKLQYFSGAFFLGVTFRSNLPCLPTLGETETLEGAELGYFSFTDSDKPLVKYFSLLSRSLFMQNALGNSKAFTFPLPCQKL